MTSLPLMPNYADHILVASPSHVVRQRVLESLRSPARRVEQASGGAEALDHLENGLWQVLFLDRSLPDLNAEELSATIRQRFPGVEIILLDSETDREMAITEREFPALPMHGLSAPPLSARVLVADSIVQAPLPGMIGGSRNMQPVYRGARLLARRDTTVLIMGPTGCGKELVARAIHNLSLRAARALWSSIARRFRRRCWNRNSSDTLAALLPAPCNRMAAEFRRRRAARCFSMRSATCR